MKKARIGLNFTSKQWIIVAVGAVVAVISIMVIWLLVNSRNSTAPRRLVANVCTEETVKKAVIHINNNKVVELEPVVAEIERNDQHQYDVNCDYILAQYYLMTGNTSSAEMYINEMVASVKAGDEYNSLLHSTTDPAVVLRERLVGMKNQQESHKGTIDGDLLNKMDEVGDHGGQ